jgi:aspartyl-tRNA(Asn)/glutamyl-tRNA(Gln) amidotransferase subunit B
MNPGYETVIGLEVHLQLLTRTKMFCACAAAYGGEPNSRTCPVCLGLPGSLPTLNREAVRMALLLGLAVGARIQPRSLFFRKQYFYPDLPKGYQITQGPVAVVEEGCLRIPGDPAVRGGSKEIRVGILRAHLEEDAGKNLHEGAETGTLVDLNRAGVPLLEIVGNPDLRSPQEASDYLKTLHRLVTFLEICDGNMEEGSFRCDANISMRKVGAQAFGTRVEVKNLNSFNFVKRALAFEAERQRALLDAGATVEPETRGWDAELGETRPQRGKEAALDYRFFPEPDLPPLEISTEEIADAQSRLPELPGARQLRWQKVYGITEYEAGMLAQSPVFADYYESLAAACGRGKAAANWMLGEMSRILNISGASLETLGLSPVVLGELINLVEEGAVSLNSAKETVLPALLGGATSAREVVEQQGLAVLRDVGDLEILLRAAIAANPGSFKQLLEGKTALGGYFIGQVRKASGGKADPQVVQAILEQLLESARGAG